MRLLRGMLVLMNVRWALAARVRGDRLFAEAEAAYDESLRRVALADAITARSRWLGRN